LFPLFKRHFSFFYYLSVSLVAAYFAVQGFGVAALPLVAASALLLAGLGVTFLGLAGDSSRKAGLFLIALALGALSGFQADWRARLDKASYSLGLERDRVESFTGTVTGESVLSANEKMIHTIDLVSVSGDTGSAGARGTVAVVCTGSIPLYTGQTVTVGAGLKEAAVDDMGTHFVAFCKDGDITVTGYSSPVWEFRHGIRQGIDSRIRAMGYPAYGLFAALFVGDRTFLPGDLHEGFRETGVLHLIALSGLNVGIVYALVGLLLLPFASRKVKFFLGGAALLAYLFLCGPASSLSRATVMLLAATAGAALFRNVRLKDSLGLACFLLLLLDPLAIRSLSFQLSFLAVWGFAVFGKRVTGFLSPWMPGFLASSLAFSLCAQAATAPLVLASFGILYPSGILVTLLLTPVITVFTWTGVAYLVLGLVPFLPLHQAASLFFDFQYDLMEGIVRFFRVVPGIEWKWQPLWILALIGAAAACEINWNLVRKGKRSLSA
jgi:ComEC/Rec2-related protein